MWMFVLFLAINGVDVEFYTRTDGKGVFETQAACEAALPEARQELIDDLKTEPPLPEGTTMHVECVKQ